MLKSTRFKLTDFLIAILGVIALESGVIDCRAVGVRCALKIRKNGVSWGDGIQEVTGSSPVSSTEIPVR